MNPAGVLTIHTDGAARGNPGPAAFAYVIARKGTSPVENAACLGDMTNNQAEYTALVHALEHALELGAEHSVVIHSDSELMVKQMRGEYRVKNEELRDLYEQARQLVGRFASVRFQHVRREQNKRADALCNEALDGESRPAGPATRTAAAAKKAPAPATDAAVREEALACLRAAAEAWARGGSGAVTPELVWEQLWSILEEHGALRTKRSASGRG
ncbi:MAG TPA: ribonuclease HI family protein [Gemmataceae bacterium]|nr:ribonuclease HI family protein [Gemmataceae bacterium]